MKYLRNLVFLALLSSGFALAQQGPYGMKITELGDVNGDGVSDVAVSAVDEFRNGLRPGFPVFFADGRVRILSGTDRSIIHDFRGRPDQFLGAVIGGKADFNADGFVDLIISAEESAGGEEFQVRSGKDGSTLYQIAFPEPGSRPLLLLFPGDINGDGIDDFVTALSSPAKNSGIVAYSGKDGSRLYGTSAFSYFRYERLSATLLGDIDFDGIKDFAIGQPLSDGDVNNARAQGLVAIYSGKTGSLIRKIYGLKKHRLFGFSLASIKDFDGDTHRDLVIGAPQASDGWYTEGDFSGTVVIVSPVSGKELLRIHDLEPNSTLGQGIRVLNDIDDDNYPDIAIELKDWFLAKRSTRSPMVRVNIYSGRTGKFLFSEHEKEKEALFDTLSTHIFASVVSGKNEVLVQRYHYWQENLEKAFQTITPENPADVNFKILARRLPRGNVQIGLRSNTIPGPDCRVHLEARSSRNGAFIYKGADFAFTRPYYEFSGRLNGRRKRTSALVRFVGENCGDRGRVESSWKRVRSAGRFSRNKRALRLKAPQVLINTHQKLESEQQTFSDELFCRYVEVCGSIV